ncbi:MAG: phosphate ABC transporter substrate-binding protein [Gallionella sp.]|nr:phosphate ABC transporter substrate-binding protein [Gallionella sp.]
MKSSNTPLHCLTFTLLLAATIASADASADVVIVVSVKNPISSITAEQASKIFLGKVTTFPNGDNAIPVDQVENTIKDEFYAKVAHKNPAQLTAYWAKIIFTGDGQPPQRLENNIAVKKAIVNNPKTIGYIDSNAVDSSVKIVLTP